MATVRAGSQSVLLVVDDLNITMKWLSYPDRRNETATAEEIEYRS